MGNHKDSAGQTYSSPGSKPAPAGSSVTVNTSNGPKQGTMTGGGYATMNKK